MRRRRVQIRLKVRRACAYDGCVFVFLLIYAIKTRIWPRESGCKVPAIVYSIRGCPCGPSTRKYSRGIHSFQTLCVGPYQRPVLPVTRYTHLHDYKSFVVSFSG